MIAPINLLPYPRCPNKAEASWYEQTSPDLWIDGLSPAGERTSPTDS
jgi:hypothetical protein